jgi:His-Xaa-Ser system radical SAM maturase HxsC
MLLSDKTAMRWRGNPFIVRVSSDPFRPEPLRVHEALLLKSGSMSLPPGFRAYFDLTGNQQSSVSSESPVISLPSSLAYIGAGDILLIMPQNGDLRVLYRKGSSHNSLLLTSDCNNYCMMCSQPPRKIRDDSAGVAWEAIPLMDIDTQQVTFTGGEPTLLGRRLIELIRRAKNYLPHTALHILTNGRLLKYLTFAKDIADVHHPDLVLGVPIYSDVAYEHDFIVQARGAFDETVKGILNAARCGLQVELRIVISRLNCKTLKSLAVFISRNFPFTCNVALMGLEPIGFGRANLNEVWIDPVDYGEYLRAAVCCLQSHRVPVSIYNHQLCTLSKELWQFARQSISDWKNIFIDDCQGCSVRHQCCGFFSSASSIHSRAITPVSAS